VSRGLSGWLERLQRLHPRDIELGLDRVSTVAVRLGILPLACPVVVVAGTNGKGSVVATLQALAVAHGWRVGAYTSPHLVHFNERICCNGRPLADDEICAAFATVEAARNDVPLTFFEFTTLAALACFASRRLDLAILEVGLGGRLDAVNLVDADIAIVTTIDIDHVDWLGPDREAIGREKAGILRPGRAALIADPDPPRSLRDLAASGPEPVLRLGQEFGWVQDHGQVNWYGRDRSGGPLQAGPVGRLQLPAASVAAALQAWALLASRFDPAGVTATLGVLGLRGRLQEVRYRGKRLLLDVAHNPGAARYLAANLAGMSTAGRVHLLLGMMADKDVVGFIAALSTVVTGTWYICDLDTPRACTAAELADILSRQSVAEGVIASSVAAALEQAMATMAADDLLVVCGSFVTVGKVLELVEGEVKP